MTDEKLARSPIYVRKVSVSPMEREKPTQIPNDFGMMCKVAVD